MQKNGKISALSKANFSEAVEIIFSQNAYNEDGSVSESPAEPISIPLVPSAIMNLFNSVVHGFPSISIFVLRKAVSIKIASIRCLVNVANFPGFVNLHKHLHRRCSGCNR